MYDLFIYFLKNIFMKRNARESKELTSWQNNLSGTRVRTHKTTLYNNRKKNSINTTLDVIAKRVTVIFGIKFKHIK